MKTYASKKFREWDTLSRFFMSITYNLKSWGIGLLANVDEGLRNQTYLTISLTIGPIRFYFRWRVTKLK